MPDPRASAASPGYDERVLLLAPTRRDAEVTCQALAAASVDCSACHGVPELVQQIDDGAGALMMTDLVLADPGIGALSAALESQPPWSNLPIVLLCRDREQSPAAPHVIDRWRNVTLLDRPASMRSMISAVQACLRGRRWQYQIRDQIVAQRQAEDALRLADQRKDEFLATLAHELRNPLAPIKTGLQLLERVSDDGERQRRLFGMMDRQLAQLVKLIDELLDVSRIATGKVVLQRERVDMRSVVEHALEASQPALDAAGHTLAVQMPQQALYVVGDPARLAQAVGNLLNNAAKYTPPRGRVGVTLAAQGGDAVVSISDNGVGIPREMLGRVFELFAQVDRTLDRSQGGLGIGLSLVRSLMALHGGSVSVHSDGVDRGSMFQIRLPAVPELPSAADDDSADQARGGQRRPLRVMIVDDNVDAADSMALLLGLYGHATHVEYGAAAALESAAAFLPEAVFCDLGMPGIGGHEFASRLRQDPRFASTLLIAVTGWGGEEDQRRSRAAGFDFHLTKPASAEHIEAILARR